MRHKFVEFIPSKIEQDVLYISIEYDIARHKCACGCGADIVTSLSPARWKLTYDGETVSLSPSIGNWNHPCNSHYFITNDKVIWAGPISKNEMQEVVKNNQLSLKRHYEKDVNGNRFFNILKRFFKL
jgi:hypothetical protein